MRDVVSRRAHGWIYFNERAQRWQMPDPTDEARQSAAHAARYDLEHMTQTQAFNLAEAFEAYHHLMTHPGGVEYAVGQLRAMRRAIREDNGEREPKR